MKKLLLLFLIVALTAMAGCSLSTPGNSQSGSDITPVYVVRFVPNGAPLINSVKVLEGNTVPEPDEPVLDGKIFDGWYADADLTIRWDFDVDVVIEDTKLYAKWIDGHTHSYSQIVTKPTCTDGGFTTFTCSCGEKYVDDKIAALGHDYVRTVVDPTCTENGYTLNKCERCDYSYQEKPTAAKGHTKIVDVAVDPTCTATGLTEGAHCQDCNVTLVEQNKIPANGHNYVSETTEPDCLSAGVITSTCTACDDIRTEEGDPALGHDVVIDTAKAPDCSNVGLTEGSHCARCGEVLVAPSIVPAKGHTEQTIPAVDPTCTESGLSAGIECSECGEVLVAQNVIDPIDHEEVVIPAVSATCSSTGLTEGKKCSVCDIVLLEQNEVEKLAHTPGAAASCTTAQVCTVCNETLVNPLGHTPVEGAYCDEAEYCQVCGEVFEGFSHTIIPATCTEPEKCSNCPYVGADALGHEYNSFVKEPTCTAAGYTHYLCVRCDDTNGNKKDNVVTKLGHDYYDMITEPTCTEEGRTTRNCYRCDVSTVTSTTPALGHAYRTTQVVEATCTAEGYTVFTCEKCSHTYNDKVTAALGHNEKKVITAATCTTDGFTTNTCTRCSNVRISDVVYALGHEYTSVIVPSKCAERGYTEHTCIRCQDKYMDSYVDELGHDYNATVVDSTCIMEGYTEHKCSRCDSNYKDNFVPTKPHVYNNGAYCVNCGSNNPEAIRIIYVLNGAENDPRNLEYFMKGSANTLYDPLSREGYEFRGWYLDEDCTIRVTSLYDITEDVTLYSKWVKVYNGNYNDGVETPDVPF